MTIANTDAPPAAPENGLVAAHDKAYAAFIVSAIESCVLCQVFAKAPFTVQRLGSACIDPSGRLYPQGEPYTRAYAEAAECARELYESTADLFVRTREPSGSAYRLGSGYVIAVAGLPADWNGAVACDAAIAAGLLCPDEARGHLAREPWILANLETLLGSRAALRADRP